MKSALRKAIMALSIFVLVLLAFSVLFNAFHPYRYDRGTLLRMNYYDSPEYDIYFLTAGAFEDKESKCWRYEGFYLEPDPHNSTATRVKIKWIDRAVPAIEVIDEAARADYRIEIEGTIYTPKEAVSKITGLIEKFGDPMEAENIFLVK